MQELFYPSKGFARKAFNVIKSSEELKVIVNIQSKSKFLSRIISVLESEDPDCKFELLDMLKMFLHIKFMTVYFYAIGANYSVKLFSGDKNLNLVYSPIMSDQ